MGSDPEEASIRDGNRETTTGHSANIEMSFFVQLIYEQTNKKITSTVIIFTFAYIFLGDSLINEFTHLVVLISLAPVVLINLKI